MTNKIKLKIGDKIYYFNQNYRVYSKDNKGECIYNEHFRPLYITNENEKEYIVDENYTINKRSNLLIMYKEKTNYYTEQEKKDNVFIKENAYKLSQIVRDIDSAEKLKKIKEILE